MPKKAPCTVLICVYKGDNSEFFDETIKSVLNQTVLPDEILIVADGPLRSDLKKIVDSYEKQGILTVIRLPRNRGAGAARNIGLKACRNELVAIMDADDIMDKKRIELQVAEFKKDPELAVLGGQLAEFKNNDINNIVAERHVPLSFEDIKKTIHHHSPINNPTIMCRRSEILGSGGYLRVNRGEDYYLFAKLIADGKKMRNLDSVLVYFRLDKDTIKRRKSLQHTKDVISVRLAIRKLGLCSWFDVFYHTFAQIIIMILPSYFVKKIYKRVRARWK